jgi:LPS-assembly protein
VPQAASPSAATETYVVDNTPAQGPQTAGRSEQPPAPAEAALPAAQQPTDMQATEAAEPEQAVTQGPTQAGTAEPGQTAAAIGPRNQEMLDQGIPWQSCTPAAIATATPAADASSLPIQVSADSVEGSDLDHNALFSGKVTVIQGNQELYADQVRYQQDSGEFHATGDALLKRPDLRIAAGEIHYNLQTRKGDASQVEYRLPGILARGTAEKAELVDAANSNYAQITYTSCRPGNQDWQLSADRLVLDTAEGLGTVSDAKLSFGGVPVMYLPTLTFPIDNRRRSGLLIPSLGYGDKTGLDLSIPYYFNLAPNYDLTLTPRVMSERGVMLGGEYRFLTSTTEGQLDAQYLPHDRKGPAGDSRRGSLSLQALSRYNENLSSALRINYVSDDNFLSDFGSNLELTSTSHLERAAELRYDTDKMDVLVRAQQFQTIDSTLSKANRPYTRLPQIAFSYRDDTLAGGSTPLAYGVAAELVDFRKSGGFVEGRRVDLQPSISTPVRDSWYHLVPKASLRYTSYRLDNQTPGLSSSPDRLTPILSLDGGLYYDRATSWFGHGATQTLEPRMYYLYVPYKNQTAIPVFDTGEYDFSFDNLFRENRFTGADRQGDANQLTLALTSRINDDASGRELLRASVGSILYLRDRKVQLPGVAANTDDTSALVGELGGDLGGGWRARTGLMWDPNENTVDRALAQASYAGPEGEVFNAAYRLRDGVSTHTDLGLIWPLGAQTRAIARWNYSLSENRNLDALAGIEYGRCCWKLRALLRQQVTGTNNSQNLSFLVQLELRGLGKLGDNIDTLLSDGIYGYRREDD